MKAKIRATGEIIEVEHDNLGDRSSSVAFYSKKLNKTFSIGELDFVLNQELKQIDWKQEKLDICKSVLPAIYIELYREMMKMNYETAKKYVKNLEKWSANRAISLADELINQLKQQSNEK